VKPKTGKIYLVGVGVGDADHITVKAQKIVEAADVVFAMGFVRDRLAALLAGKDVYDAGHGYFTATPLNDAPEGEEDRYRKIVRDAVGESKTVAVLDFGDPSLFSPQRGYLTEFADLAPEVIPGLSSFNIANAALCGEITGGTGRAVVLAEAVSGREDLPDRLAKLAATGAMLAFFTMKMDLPMVTGELLKYLPAETPAVIVAHAGYGDKQTVLRATLGTLAERTVGVDLPWAHMLYVGGVASCVQ
jgi:precorrin-4/cobalt-precorrin-4 C11-methyltransferase